MPRSSSTRMRPPGCRCATITARCSATSRSGNGERAGHQLLRDSRRDRSRPRSVGGPPLRYGVPAHGHRGPPGGAAHARGRQGHPRQWTGAAARADRRAVGCAREDHRSRRGAHADDSVRAWGVRGRGPGGAWAHTQSHNRAQWNGFKFFLAPDRPVLDGAQTERLILSLPASAPDVPSASPIDNRQEQAAALHLASVLKQVNAESIRRRRFLVALDAACGAGERPAACVLEALGCTITRVDVERESEPLPEYLTALSDAVVHGRCAVGFAQDLDGDRLALTTETGIAPGEDYTLVLVVDHLLRRPHPSIPVVVKNVSTTRALDDVVTRAGAEQT